MPTDFPERCEKIEECYEFMLAYAGQGLPRDQGSHTGAQVRDFLQSAGKAMEGLAESCEAAVAEDGVKLPETAFVAVLRRDAQDSLAMFTMVLAQPAISSQLIDNLNASIHLRALLTDMFLVGEILRSRSHVADMSGRA